MTPQPPSAFCASPEHPQPHPLPQGPGAWQAARVLEVPAGPARASLPPAVSTLTIYPDGFSCLNAAGSKLVATFDVASLCLFAPEPVRPGRRPKLWELGPGSCHALSAHPDKPAQLRFRVPPAEAPAPGRYALMPIPGESQRFSLLPL